MYTTSPLKPDSCAAISGKGLADPDKGTASFITKKPAATA